MPSLPHVSGAEIQRALERPGFHQVRQVQVAPDEFVQALRG